MAEPITKGSDTTRHQLDYTSSSTTSSYTTANSSPANSTSTYRYEHEPFESFQHRIPKLGPQLGGEITEIQRMRGGGVSASLTAGIIAFEVDIDVPNPAALASTLPDLVFTHFRGHLDVVREQQGSDDYHVEIHVLRMPRYVFEAIPMVPIPTSSPVDTASQRPSEDLGRPHLTSHTKETQMRIDRRILDN
ncbi:hypothetical protein LTS18_007775, partial [Coniosporium uncinatum]